VLAAGVALALFLAGHFPKSHPIIPALNFGLPGTSPHGHIATSAAEFGSTFTLSGTTPERREGTVLVEGSWNDAPWLPLASATTTGGTYVARFQITDHGTLKLKAKYPGGGEADGTVLVP
jgi:hypothetical protein